MIVSQFDKNYLHWSHLFLRSLFLTNPDERVYFNTVNLNKDDINQFSIYGNRVTINNVNILSVNKSFMANRKVKVYQDVINMHLCNNYLFLDIDILFRKSLSDLYKQVEGFDAGIVFRSGYYEGKIWEQLKVAAGLIFVRQKGFTLIDNWDKLMSLEAKIDIVHKGQWYWDQITLWEATKITDIKYSNVEEFLYLNHDMDKSVYIWSANKPPKELMFKLFSEEFERMKNGQRR